MTTESDNDADTSTSSDLPTAPSPLIERAVELDCPPRPRSAAAAASSCSRRRRAGQDGAARVRRASLAAEAGWLVRRAAPGPLERHFSFGVVRALLEAPVRESGVALDGAAAAAGELLLEGKRPRGDST